MGCGIGRSPVGRLRHFPPLAEMCVKTINSSGRSLAESGLRVNVELPGQGRPRSLLVAPDERHDEPQPSERHRGQHADNRRRGAADDHV